MSWMAYRDLRVNEDGFTNPRTKSGLDKASIRSLAEDIAARGLIYPLVVTSDGLILGGHRRHAAIRILILDGHPEGVKLRSRVPVIVRDHDRDGDALADGLHRVDLSTYEIAAKVAEMAEAQSGATVARKISKSRTYVSRMLKAWRGAGAALKVHWRNGSLPYDTIKRLADLPEEHQAQAAARELALGTRRPKKGGSHGRPGVTAVKERLHQVEAAYGEKLQPKSYAAGVRDALEWATGGDPGGEFAEMLETSPG